MSRRLGLKVGVLLAGGVALGACSLLEPPSRSFTVFFDDRSAVLSPAGLDAVAAAATVARRYPTTRVNVMGFSSASAAPAGLDRLSGERANAVAVALATRGIDPARIAVGARGPVAVEFADVEGRRVEILLADPDASGS